MFGVRRLLGRATVLWLLSQAAAVALVPSMFWSIGVEAVPCTCDHGSHAYCPMHHKPAPGEKICFMRSTTGNLAVLSTLLGASAPQADAQPVARASRPAAIVVRIDTTARSIAPPAPEPPPPRA